MPLDHKNRQGGKQFGELKERQAGDYEEVNQKFLSDDAFKDVEELEDKLTSYKATFIKFDLDYDGSLDMMDVKQMMEVMGVAKTHLEIKKMIAEVDTTNTGAICYEDFVNMMLGAKASVLKLILMFEEKSRKEKDQDRPKGLPPKKKLTDLP